MKFLIVSPEMVGGAIGCRLTLEGNDVSIYTKNSVDKHLLDGMVDKVTSLEEGLAQKPDCVVFDYVHSGKMADELRDKGFNVIGGSRFADMIELDRMWGYQMAENVGIKVPPYHPFAKNDIAGAIAFIEETEGRYVLKPNGNLGLALTYVSKEPRDMIEQLQWIEREGMMKSDFTLQEFVEGVEISTECWFSHGEYIGPPNGTLEQKKFMTGDLGPNTGCESSVVWPYQDDNSKIVKQTIKKLYPILRGVGYTGPIDVNSIVTESGDAYFLEFTPRFGYSALYALTAILDQDLGKLLHGIASGRARSIKFRPGFGMALTVSMPPYPLEPNDHNGEVFKDIKGHKVFNAPSDSNWWPYDIFVDESGDQAMAGTCGLVGFITDTGIFPEVTDQVYQMAEEMEVAGKMYRVDADARARQDLPKLSDLGYEVPELEYQEAT